MNRAARLSAWTALPLLLLAGQATLAREEGNILSRAFAVARAAAPHYLQLQYAGYTGWFSLGAGYSFREGRIEPELLYGYVPGFVSSTPVHTLAQKTVLSPVRVPLTHTTTLYPVQVGYSANFVVGKNYFLFPPDRYPRKDYYWPTAFHLAYFGGMKIRHDFETVAVPRAAALGFQVGMLTHYWRSHTYNDRVGLRDILSLSLSVQGYF